MKDEIELQPKVFRRLATICSDPNYSKEAVEHASSAAVGLWAYTKAWYELYAASIEVRLSKSIASLLDSNKKAQA